MALVLALGADEETAVCFFCLAFFDDNDEEDDDDADETDAARLDLEEALEATWDSV